MHTKRSKTAPITETFVLGLLIFICAQQPRESNQQHTVAATTNNADHKLAGNASGQQTESVDSIVKDTMLLLEAFDQRLASVAKRAPGAMMRDNLRSLDNDQTVAAKLDHEAAIELARLTSNEPLAVAEAEQMASSGEPLKLDPPGEALDTSKRARQLELANDNQPANDSTERHIKFTLDLMQSIFASQSYSAKSNQIESFMISPLSIQMVLMMMHLGARGQTRREISNCLHLTQANTLNISPLGNEPTSSSGAEMTIGNSSQASKLKRRHQLMSASNEQASGKLSSSNGNQAGGKSQVSSLRHQSAPTQTVQQQQRQDQVAHELFGAALRNLNKDPIVMKALSSANQVFLQKNLPLATQYDWAIKHYYAAEVKQVDFQNQQQQQPKFNLNSSAPLQQSGPQQSLSSLTNFAPSDQTPVKTKNNATASANLNSTVVDQQQLNNVQQIINDWVERQTMGRISNFLSSPVSTATLMMAINVLFFKGDWQYKFDPQDTQTDAWFTQANGKNQKIPMMVNRLPLAFAHDAQMKTSVIELPYKAQRLGLFLLLPDDVSGIFHTMQMLNSSSFSNLISSMRKPSPGADQASNGISIRIPKFTIDSTPRLSQIFSQHLGLKSLFTPEMADLSGMFASASQLQKQRNQNNETSNTLKPPTHIALDELLHKAVLQVDEQGSVAAASSATIVERVGLFNSNYFEADHPFLLFLMDKQTGLVLFSGVFAGDNNKDLAQQSRQ